MLASDVTNREFAGAVSDADAALIVQFYVRAVQNIFQSSKAGRPIFDDIIYTKINVPGLKDMEVDRPTYELDKKRFPRQWQMFEQQTKGDAREVGTPLSEWPVLTRSQAEEFRALKFFTVESIANAGDANLNALGMIGGMSPYALREKARAFLKAATDSALPQHQAEELAKRDAEIAMLKEQMAQLAQAIKPNAAPQANTPSAVPPKSPAVAAPRKRGRPTNAEIAARKAAQAST